MDLNHEINKIFHKKFKWNWMHFFIGMAAFIPTLILFIVFVGFTRTPPVWFNWIMFAIFVPSILWSLFMAQKMELVGAYGETILLLIPTFVWLLPGHDHAITVMIIIAFTLIMLGTVMYYGAQMFRLIKTRGNESFLKKLAPVLIRLAFVAMSVVSTLIVSIILINWGDYGLKLIPAAEKLSTGQGYSYGAWIIFIAIVTILVALGLVLLGLSSQFNFYFKRQNKKTFGQAVKESRKANKKSTGYVEKTMQINIAKRRWWQRHK